MKSTNTIIIGAGQAGLSASYYLLQKEIPHFVLDKNDRIGDQWSNRWDSLELFTPAEYNDLPGRPFPAPKGSLPTKDMVADYLKQYANEFNLPVKLSVEVKSVRKEGEKFVVETSEGDFDSENVIVATGAFQKPFIPKCAKEISEEVLQLHTSEYKNPSQLKPGTVLVAGTGNSGVQIAEELSRTHDVILAGRDNGSFPRSFLGKDIYWWLKTLGLLNATIHHPIVKRMRKKETTGDPLVGRKMSKVGEKCALKRAAKVQTAKNGSLVMEDNVLVAMPDNIIWATGFQPDFSWIKLDIFKEDGYPNHERGVVKEVPGLYFLGLKLLFRLNSSLIGGVGRDAEYIAGRIEESARVKV